MRGIDGIVVPDLRGVSLWLAARNAAFRRPLIESDPVGIAFHGDAEHFSLEETALLFHALEAQLKHQHLTEQWERASSASLSSLMAGPGREILYGMLRAPDRSEFRQRFVERLLRGLGEETQRDALSGLSGSEKRRDVAQAVLAKTIRDPTWRHDVRSRALTELVWVHENLPGSPSTLMSLLRELADGTLPETETGSLSHGLLDHLYPRHLDAERFWDYVEKLWAVPPPTEESWYGDRHDWARRLVLKLSPSDMSILLETLVRKARTLNKVLVQNKAESFVDYLLTRGLQLFGEDMEPAELYELYEWFELVQAADNGLGLVLAHCQPRVSFSDMWPKGLREIRLALVLEGLKRNASQPRDRALDHEIGVKFLGDDTPPGFRRWCLQKAAALAETEPATAIELTHWTVTDRKAWGPPLNDEEILTAVRDTPLLLEWHAQHVAAATQPRQARQTVQDRESREADVLPARTDSAGLKADLATPEKLQELGQAYLSGFRSNGISQARTELGRLLGDDNNLRDSAIRSLRNFATRSDLPALDEIARDHGRGQCSTFSATFLAGIIEEEAAGPYPLELLDNDVLRRALGFYLLSGLHTRSHPIPFTFKVMAPKFMAHERRPKHELPGWYLCALENYPETVADTFVTVIRAHVCSKEPPGQHIFDLAWEPEYSRIGLLAVPRMLATFPSRCTRNQVLSLQAVLWAALNHMPSDDLRQLILRRLELKAMDPAQLATWLGAGLFVDRETCVPMVMEFLANGTKTRCRHLLDFLVPNLEPLLNQEWPTSDLAALIRATGAKQSTPLDVMDYPPVWKPLRLLELWAGTLADRVDEESVAALADLAKDPTLENCHGNLLRARDRQSLKRRVSLYKAPTTSEIRNGLKGGPPAGPADLAALVADKLSGLAMKIRDGNTDDWQQYWHTDPGDPKGRKVSQPKAENPCRDALLSDLQMLLAPLEVDAQPEGHHAEDARSDIIAVHGVHAVVVEIKKTDSHDLWSAPEGQLIGKYARDPRSGGYGIFLVLWFGVDNLRRPSPAGTKPSSPEELRNILEETLTHEQRRTIAVIVLDVSAPAGRVQSANMENTCSTKKS